MSSSKIVDERLAMRTAVVIIALALGACAGEPRETLTVVLIPDLPKVDQALRVRPVNPGCVKDKSAKTIGVRELTSERDCFSASSLKNQGHVIALQDSINEIDAAVAKLKASKRPAKPN
jgi:hypothetical protein